MGKRYIAFIDADLLAGAVAAEATRRGSIPELEVPLLSERAAMLRAFASDLYASKGGDYERGQAVVSMLRNPSGGADQAAAPSSAAQPAAADYTLLEGIGAVELDDSHFDPAALEAAFGVTLYPADVELRIPAPLAKQTPGGAHAAWHLTRIGSDQCTAPLGDGVLVGVLDTGIDGTHPEFAGKTIHFQRFDRTGRGFPGTASDAGNHGTHVSGLIAGKTCGVAPLASLAVAQVLTTSGANGLSGTLIQVAAGLNWLLTASFRPEKRGVDIVNASLGGDSNQYLHKAISATTALVCAAIGNNGLSGQGGTGSPGNYAIQTLLGVGATDQGDVVADFSDWDSQLNKPDMCAPGAGVLSALPGGQFGLMSGTSMAAPVCAGAAARILSGTPGMSAAALRAALLANAVPAQNHHLGNRGGAGRVQLW